MGNCIRRDYSLLGNSWKLKFNHNEISQGIEPERIKKGLDLNNYKIWGKMFVLKFQLLS